MEALEYLCGQCAKKGDEGYLLGMMNKIATEQGKMKENHKKYILNTIAKINKK